MQNLASIQPRTDRLKFGGTGYGPQGSTGARSTAQATEKLVSAIAEKVGAASGSVAVPDVMPAGLAGRAELR